MDGSKNSSLSDSSYFYLLSMVVKRNCYFLTLLTLLPPGYYVYIEASNMGLGDNAWLVSQIYSPTETCFKFWYHMYGSGKLPSLQW